MFQSTKNVINFKNNEKVLSFEEFYKIFRKIPLLEYLMENNLILNEK